MTTYKKVGKNKDRGKKTHTKTHKNITKSTSSKSSKSSKKQPSLCKGLTFEDCELAILRNAVDKIETVTGEKTLSSPTIKKIISIVENFLRKKKLICYGGTAINNILPVEDQFYNKDVELPDYDFFSHNALDDAKELADIYFREGYEEVEAKAGVHHGTYKVFVNFIPVADITYLDTILYKQLSKQTIRVNGIHYCPPNYLRMSMYLELSRPQGDVSRWEKVLKRLSLLNKHYPLVGENCEKRNIQRLFESKDKEQDEIQDIFFIVRDSCIDQGLVFFGAYSHRLYLNYLPKEKKREMLYIPDFDVLSETPHISATIIKERLEDAGYKKIKIVKKGGVGEVIAPHYEVILGNDTVAFIYEPLACHSYNVAKISGRSVKIASIDTILSFYLAFIYANRPYFDVERILCMCEYLFYIQEQNRLNQKGLLRRFSMNCYGKQETIETIREEKTQMYKKLADKRGTREYDEWFLKYSPSEEKKKENREEAKEEAKRNTRKLRNSRKLRKLGKTMKQSRKRKQKRNTKGFLQKIFNL